LSTAAGTTTTTTDVSAFISNLPDTAKTATATTTDATIDCAGDGEAEDAVPDFLDTRTRSFGTKDASGLTSQAMNVIEALESGALLVDEDVSAANFMARDGRMHAMIMDEPIMPLLYRVNGLFLLIEHGRGGRVARRGRFRDPDEGL
jgi:predicted ABC-class ATPase